MILFAIGAIPLLLLLGTIHAASHDTIWGILEKVVMSVTDGLLIPICVLFLMELAGIELSGITWRVIAIWIDLTITIWTIGWMWHWWKNRGRIIVLLLCFVLLGCAGLAFKAYMQHLNGITYEDYFNSETYYPTSDSFAIELEKPSELCMICPS